MAIGQRTIWGRGAEQKPAARAPNAAQPSVPPDASAGNDDLSRVQSLRARVWDADFRPVPVYSVEAGRRLGHQKPGKQPFGNGWIAAARRDPPGAVTDPPHPDATNTGILCDGLRPLDFDIEDADLAAQCFAIAREMFGDAPVRFRNNSPRKLMLLRAAEGEPRKRRIVSDRGKIEVLGWGQQFVAFGDHESGTMLQWLGDAPGAALFESIPSVTEQQVEEFLARCASFIGTEPEQYKNGEDHRSGEPQAELLRIAAALNDIRNDGPPDWEYWNRVGMATWRATGGNEQGLALFNEWSKRNPNYDEAHVRERWCNYHRSPPTEIGAGTIFHLAKEARAKAQPSDEPPPDWEEASQPPPENETDEGPITSSSSSPRADGQQSAGESHTSGAENPDATMQSEAKTRETADRLPDGVLAPEVLLNFFNRRYMLVKDAGKVVILEPLVDPILRRRYFDRLSIADFKALYANRDVSLGRDGDGDPMVKRAAEFWLRHAQRRQYLGGVVFRPGQAVAADTFNLWEGFVVTPQPGCCQRLYDHIRDVICRGDAALFSWLINWIARMLQQPGERAEVCVVIRGTEEGSGKSTLGRVLMRLLGQHAFAITDPRHLIGGFNGHLRDCVFLLGDEAFYAGDKAHVGILKTIITEPTLTIEGKFRDAILSPNFLHVMLTANAEWVVPASLTARRFLVLDASPRHAGDHEYFRALWSELEAGGFSAFLHDMLHRDLSSFNWRQPPDTAGLQEQKKRSLPTEHAWWVEVLHRGYVWQSKLGLENYFAEWHDVVATELLFASYQEFAKNHHEWSPLSREDLGKLLRKLGAPTDMRNAVVGEHMTDANTDRGGVRREAACHIRKRAHGYRFGPLKDARAAFTSQTRLTIEWEPSDDLFPDA